MYIIVKEPNKNGSRPSVQFINANNLIPETHFILPKKLLSIFYPEDKQCAGFVNITAVDEETQTVLAMEWNEEAYQAYLATLPPPVVPTSAELREKAYNEDKVIEWDGKMLTVTEAANLWQYYAAEGSEKADELQALIVEAKAKIREQYPD